MRFVFAAICVLAGCVAFGGCGERDKDDKAALTVAVVPKGTIHEFWKSVHAGAEKAGEELGVEILWKGALREDDRDAQISVVQNMIVRDVDGIVLAPLDSTALRPTVDEAMQQDIPVVIFDSGLAGDNYVSYVATDNYLAGQLAGDHMAEILGGKGSVVVLRYAEGSDSTMQRENGFLDAIGRHERIEVASSNQYAGVTVESTIKAAENLLLRFGGPDGELQIDGMFCATEPTTFGLMRALEDMGYAGKISVIGFDSSERMIAGLREGKLDGFVVQDPMKIGYLGVKTLVRHLRGGEVERRIDTDSILVTGENIDEPEIQSLLNPDLDRRLK